MMGERFLPNECNMPPDHLALRLTRPLQWRRHPFSVT